MTIPIWAPFAALTALCAFYPRPAWTRRVDWLIVAVWAAAFVYCGVVWFDVALFIRWLA